MGYPMAGHLARAGHRVTVYNRSADKAARWVSAYGGHAAATPAAAARDAELVMMCVGNDADVRAVITGADGALAAMRKARRWSITRPPPPTWRATCTLQQRRAASPSSTRPYPAARRARRTAS